MGVVVLQISGHQLPSVRTGLVRNQKGTEQEKKRDTFRRRREGFDSYSLKGYRGRYLNTKMGRGTEIMVAIRLLKGKVK